MTYAACAQIPTNFKSRKRNRYKLKILFNIILQTILCELNIWIHEIKISKDILF